MADEITLQDLIEKVKTDLFTPLRGTPAEGKIVYPIFLVDQVELEIQVEIQYNEKTGLTISIPQVVGGQVSAGQGRTSGHTMRITLKPILTAVELRARIQEDPRLAAGIAEASLAALRKGGGLTGIEE